MDELTRRGALQRTAGVGLLAAFLPGEGAQGEGPDVPKEEREHVLAVGMTEGEADCWVLAANLAGRFFALPELHPMDKQEVATAIHVIQNKLLSRPTYRRYREIVKAAHRK
jgi:hypothetical protein